MLLPFLRAADQCYYLSYEGLTGAILDEQVHFYARRVGVIAARYSYSGILENMYKQIEVSTCTLTNSV